MTPLTASREAGSAAPERRLAAAVAVGEEGQAFDAFCAPLLAASPLLATRLASPLLGRAWAAALVMHWSRLHHLGGLDLRQPLYVVDLAPAEGQLAAALLPALVGELRAHGMQDWPVRYLACSPTRAAQTALDEILAQHAGLAAHLASGLLDTAHWPARTGQPLVHGRQRQPLFGARNPVAALALGGWSCQPSRLYAVHHGSLREGRVRIASAEADGSQPPLSYHWPQLEASACATAEALLLAHYLGCVPSAALLLSECALAEVDAVANFSAGRYLLLGADAGVAEERQIRGQALAPPEQVEPGRLLLPVNFHALAQHQRMAGAVVEQRQCEDGGWVLHLACRDDPLGVDASAWAHLVQTVLQAHPGDRERDCASAVGVHDAAALNHQLRRSACDPWVLSDALREQDPAQFAHDPISARALCCSIDAAWAHAGPASRSAAFGMTLARHAAELGDWGLARRVLAQSQAEDSVQAAQLLHLRAELEARTGNAEEALQWARRALQADTGSAATRALVSSLRERLSQWLGQRWYAPRHMRAGELCLELLHEGHREELLRQMRDPLIGVMTQMHGPRLDVGPEDEGSVEYALMHAGHGLVGQLGFRHHADMAHFHIWIGTDHQGQGFGSQALAALLAVLAAGGIEHVFSTVYRDNQRCRRLLARAGFAELQGDDDDELVVHRASAACGLSPSAAQLWQRWSQLCVALEA
ncbi:GNAT family N-acetyltransferase [Burkholderiaceae bacterium UC74_6]